MYDIRLSQWLSANFSLFWVAPWKLSLIWLVPKVAPIVVGRERAQFTPIWTCLIAPISCNLLTGQEPRVCQLLSYWDNLHITSTFFFSFFFFPRLSYHGDPNGGATGHGLPPKAPSQARLTAGSSLGAQRWALRSIWGERGELSYEVVS